MLLPPVEPLELLPPVEVLPELPEDEVDDVLMPPPLEPPVNPEDEPVVEKAPLADVLELELDAPELEPDDVLELEVDDAVEPEPPVFVPAPLLL